MYLASFLLGLTGSLHCVGMCGPIAMMVSGRPGSGLLLNRILYNLGRTFTYVAMGVVVGILGKLIQWGNIQGKVSIAVGVLMIIALLIPKIQQLFLPAISGWVVKLKHLFARHLQSGRTASALITGILNGFLPCGLVYAGLAIALVQSSILESGMAMILFGLGTMPALMLAAYSWGAIRKIIPWSFQHIQTFMLVLVAVLMIWRGLNAETHLFHQHGADVICTPE